MIFNPVYGGASAPNLGTKTITSNGTYQASSDNLDGYSEVTANVPNTYAAADEGKVVDNGALVVQTSRSIIANGTYDTTLNDEVVINVSGGGGATLITKAITANGTYDASDDNADGYSSVTVSVQGEMLSPAYYDVASAYLGTDGKFYWGTGTIHCLNIFTVQAHHSYEIYLGESVGNRYRVHYYANKGVSDFAPYLSAPTSAATAIFTCTMNISGSTEINDMTKRLLYTPHSDGVIIVGTSNQSQRIEAYCVDTGIYNINSAYTRVEYIEVQNTTGPYIDTGITQTNETYYEIDVQAITGASGYFYGALTSPYTEIGVTSNDFNVYINGTKYAISHGMTRHAIKASASKLLLDGGNVNTSITWPTTNAAIYLFARSSNNAPFSFAQGIRIYHLKIWRGGVLVRDFYPCYRNSDNEAGVYDAVNGVFYPNIGTGSFAVGSDI